MFTNVFGAQSGTWTRTAILPRELKSLVSTKFHHLGVVTPEGLEPSTHWLKASCSTDWAMRSYIWLTWQDSNLRIPGSKPGALPLGYRSIRWWRGRDSNPRTQREMIYSHLRLTKLRYPSKTLSKFY